MRDVKVKKFFLYFSDLQLKKLTINFKILKFLIRKGVEGRLADSTISARLGLESESFVKFSRLGLKSESESESESAS